MDPTIAAGIGLRHPHAHELMRRRPGLGFVEVHSENYFEPGGAARALLQGVRADYAVSLHGVGLSLGSADGIDPWHLARLAELTALIEPVRVSDHASFARVLQGRGLAPPWHGCDLLPVAFTDAALAIMTRNIQQVQDALRRPLLVENLSAYLGWADDAIAEPEFFNELARRTGCGLLVDVNNLVVNALNVLGSEAREAEAVCRVAAWLEVVNPAAVGEIHLAGYTVTDDDLVIDDHGSRVHPPVWAAYEHALRCFGPVPTLVEWDTDLPALDVLLAEAAQADARCKATCEMAS